MKTLKMMIGIVFGAATTVALAMSMLGAAILGIIPGVLWLLGDALSGGFVSEWIEKPFEIFKDHLKDSL